MSWRSVFEKKQKYITRTVELAESFFMELQVCQFEALEERYDKAKQTELKAMFWHFLVKLRIEHFVYKMIHAIS